MYDDEEDDNGNPVSLLGWLRQASFLGSRTIEDAMKERLDDLDDPTAEDLEKLADIFARWADPGGDWEMAYEDDHQGGWNTPYQAWKKSGRAEEDYEDLEQAYDDQYGKAADLCCVAVAGELRAMAAALREAEK